MKTIKWRGKNAVLVDECVAKTFTTLLFVEKKNSVVHMIEITRWTCEESNEIQVKEFSLGVFQLDEVNSYLNGESLALAR